MVSRGALQPQPFWESLKGGLTCVERDLVDRRHAESGEHRNGNGANCMGMWTALSVGTRMHRARGWGLSKVWGRCKHVTGMAPSTEVGTSVSVELVTALSMSTGFIWVKSLHRSLYGAMVWICDQNSVGNTPMFQLWLNSACTVSRPFLPLPQPRQRAGWGCTRPWEGTQLGQLTPNDQRDIPYLMMSAQQSNCELLLLPDWLGISRLVVSNCGFLHRLFSSFCFVFLIKLSLSQPTRFCIFNLLILSPVPLQGRVSQWLCGA